MGLASEDEWESDPELRALRREFVQSFSGRKEALESLLPALLQGKAGEAVFEQTLVALVRVAHKLAGAAETYGFPTLTRVSSMIEDWYSGTAPAKREPLTALQHAEALIQRLKQAESLGKDPEV